MMNAMFWADDIFLPSDEASRSESDDVDREIEEFKRSVLISHQSLSLGLSLHC